MAATIRMKIEDLEQIVLNARKAQRRDWSLSNTIKFILPEQPGTDKNSNLVAVCVENAITGYTDKKLGDFSQDLFKIKSKA